MSASDAATEDRRALRLRAVLVVWFLGALTVYGVAVLPGGLRGRAYAALATVELVFALCAMHLAESPAAQASIVRVGMLARVALVLTPTFTSNDATRYIWDGAAALAGFDPYSYSPRGIAAHVHGFTVPVDNAGYVTLYPPAALGTFVLAASFGARAAPFVWKVIVMIASMATLHVSARTLARHGRGGAIALVALSPVLVFEGSVGAHVDVLAALTVACGAEAWLEKRFGRASAWIALGGLVKLSPALALIPLFFAAPRERRMRMLAAGSAVFLGGYTLAAIAGLRPIGSLGAFLSDWRFGSPIFFALEHSFGTSKALIASSLLFAATLVASIVVALRLDPLRGALIALVAPFVASPVVFPWYLAAQTPLVALRPSATWLAWAGALPLTYEVLDRVALGEPWSGDGAVLAIVVATVVVGAIVDARRRDSARVMRARRTM